VDTVTVLTAAKLVFLRLGDSVSNFLLLNWAQSELNRSLSCFKAPERF